MMCLMKKNSYGELGFCEEELRSIKIERQENDNNGCKTIMENHSTLYV